MTRPLVLIVEDNLQLSEIYALTLSDLFETETILDGSHALARLAEVVPHLVILDINLPGASGKEILHAIRTDPRLEAVRVILATANPIQADELQDKADITLLKPISPAQLRGLAERLK
jgi:CheY-like chemotaxis protein